MSLPLLPLVYALLGNLSLWWLKRRC